MTSCQITIVGGPVAVAYKRLRGGWMAQAPECGQAGIGSTREAALEDLNRALLAHLGLVLRTRGRVPFATPRAEHEDEAGNEDRERLCIVIQAQIAVDDEPSLDLPDWSRN